MSTLELFFDYACPYCLTGHENLVALLPQFPSLEIVWRPCESHPRPERYGRHSDLCIQGMFYALEQGADIWEYHRRMYAVALTDRIDIENPAELAKCVDGLLDSTEFYNAVAGGKYKKDLADANNYAFRQSGVWVVPAYRMGGRKLDSIENIGVTKKQLSEFLKG
ncbi:MAG: DsbA family protein [Prevotellaceae bacterium]|jgi:predicted DsbA family dithiol-disulfide isomerase|nr:DsbA family protein [Prevotellaceae bacterium]